MYVAAQDGQTVLHKCVDCFQPARVPCTAHNSSVQTASLQS